MKRLFAAVVLSLSLLAGSAGAIDFFPWELRLGAPAREFRDSPVFASADIVAVYYGTTQDDDNPGWGRDATAQATSWYNETLNTATRGATRAFPAEYLIVAESDTVTIYDATYVSLPMWRVHDYTGYAVAGITMINGVMAVATGTDLIVEDYGDEGQTIYDTGSTPAIVNNVVNAVAATLLDAAATNPATGMRYVTIDAFTAGGTSRIQYVEGAYTVYDLVDTASDTHVDGVINPAADSIAINTTDPAIDIYEDVDGDTNTVDRTYGAATTPALLSAPSVASKIVAYGSTITHGNADGLTVIDENPSTPASGACAYITTGYNTGMMRGDIQLATLADTTAGDVVDTELVTNGTFDADTDWTKGTGWTIGSNVASCDGTQAADSLLTTSTVPTTVAGKYYIVSFEVTAYTAGNVALQYDGSEVITDKAATGTYSVGVLAGDTTGVIDIVADLDFVGSVDNVLLTEAIPDRCVQANHLTVTGTLTKAAVATGAELMGWSGWSASDYASLPYTSDLDNGTGDFYVSAWVKGTDAYGVIAEAGTVGTNGFRLDVYPGTTSEIRFYLGTVNIVGTTVLNIDKWFKLDAYRKDGVLYVAVNGIIENSVSCTDDMSHSGDLYVGLRANLTVNYSGAIVLLKTPKTAPTAAQIETDYLKELPMFQPGAKCTLSGSSDSVLALDYDSTTEKLTVLTDVVDVFDGLTNISQGTFNGTAQAVSADNNSTLIGTSTEVSYDRAEGWY